jgi:hypothetical protein
MKIFEYAVLRVIPRVERGETMNVGVILYCQAEDFLGCRTHVDVDVDGVRAALKAVDGICCGGPRAGQAAGESLGARFRWLTAPRSTVVQPGPVHSGLTADAGAELDRLLDVLVR